MRRVGARIVTPVMEGIHIIINIIIVMKTLWSRGDVLMLRADIVRVNHTDMKEIHL